MRAVGPSLAAFGVAGTLADPVLTLVDPAGRVVAQNDNWGQGGDPSAPSTAAAQVGAFPLPAGSRDAALLVRLPPGNYSAQVSGANGAGGVALVEVYDADAVRTSRLRNIATRGLVGTGDNALIAGLVVTSPGPHTFLVRAVGPGLATFAFPGILRNPFLQIYQDETLLHENDDWTVPTSAQAALQAAATQVGAFPLAPGRDAALLITLQPEAYTAKVSGVQGATGVALVEIYELP